MAFYVGIKYQKVERIQEWALGFLYGNICNTSYESLLHLSGKTSMFVSRLKCLCTEIYKIHNINPKYIKNIFFRSTLRRSTRYKYNIDVQKHNQVSFGKNSHRVLGPGIWNVLPNDIKGSENLHIFKNNMEKLGGENCPIMAKFSSNMLAFK